MLGQTLATRAEEVYRALLEATAFGTRMIVETFDDGGRAGDRVRRRRRAAEEPRTLMQTYADVLRLPISTIASEQGPALGSAIHAAVAAGAYPDVRTAGEAMGARRTATPTRPTPAPPTPTTRSTPSTAPLHDYFGRGGNDVMQRAQGDPPRRRSPTPTAPTEPSADEEVLTA